MALPRHSSPASLLLLLLLVLAVAGCCRLCAVADSVARNPRFPLPGHAAPPVCSVVTIPVSEDAYVLSGRPSANFGSRRKLLIADTTQVALSFLQFPLSEAIPRGATIERAQLLLPMGRVVTPSGNLDQTFDWLGYDDYLGGRRRPRPQPYQRVEVLPLLPQQSFSRRTVTYNRRPQSNRANQLAVVDVVSSSSVIDVGPLVQNRVNSGVGFVGFELAPLSGTSAQTVALPSSRGGRPAKLKVTFCSRGSATPEPIEPLPIPVCFSRLANDPQVCSSRGACLAPNRCVCQIGWTGTKCEHQFFG